MENTNETDNLVMIKSHMTEDPLINYIAAHSVRLTDTQKRLIEVTKQHPLQVMLGSAEGLQLLANLVRVIGGKKTLDIGVFTGYSALTIAMALPADGKVIALDINDEFVNIGRPFWKEAGVEDKIDVRMALAVESLEALIADGQSGTFDFAFIDADKINYMNYYELSLKLVRSGGIIAIDNVLWFGKVLDDTITDPDTVAIRALNDKLLTDDRINVSMIQISDGTTLAFKK